MQYYLISELLLYQFELGQNTKDANKNICCVKNEDPVDHNTVTRWFKKFHSYCKNNN